jgi:hypothetical protein
MPHSQAAIAARTIVPRPGTRLLAGLLATTTALSSPAMACAPAYNPATVYTQGMTASENATNYVANWWVQGSDPAANSSQYQAWTQTTSCSTCTAAPSVAPQNFAVSAITSGSVVLSWNQAAIPFCSVTGYAIYQNGTLLGTVPYPYTQVTIGGLNPSTSYAFSIATQNVLGSSAPSAAVVATTAAPYSGPLVTTGTIGFHLVLGTSTAQDTMTLDGDGYTDLIESNIIAGVMYAHLVSEGFPGMQFNRDYLVGSIMGQLLQENIATEDYHNPPQPVPNSANLIDPATEQQAVMGVGQGGPYQINNYALDMGPGGRFQPIGTSLINYIAIQKNIGYSYADAANQNTQPTPASFNDKYYGPMLPAFFHYNDMVAMYLYGTAPGWQPSWAADFVGALQNFETLPNSFLDVVLNVAYNQGYYGTLLDGYSVLGKTATAATVTQVDSYQSVWGKGDTFMQYPYQVHYYIDQLFDNPTPSTGGSVLIPVNNPGPFTLVTPGNHVLFPMTGLGGVFANVFAKLSYSDGTAPAQFFSTAQAQAAFAAALAQNNVTSATTLDLSNPGDRAVIFAVIDAAIGSLEATVGMKFTATTLQQL